MVLTLGLGMAPVLHGARAAEAPAVAPTPGSAPATLSDLAARVEELTEHIHGMEGKLKESAAARRSADQARMEAERRLAEGTQETGRLSAEIDLLRDAKAALEARLAHAEEQATQGVERLAAQEERVRRLTAEGEAQARRSEGLERQIEQLKDGQHQAEETRRGLVREAQTAQAELSGKLGERDGELERLRADLTAVTAERTALEARLRAMSALVPAPEGGTQWRAIYEANRNVLPDPDRLTPGMTLVIP